jgi:hypothetical protein
MALEQLITRHISKNPAWNNYTTRKHKQEIYHSFDYFSRKHEQEEQEHH